MLPVARGRRPRCPTGPRRAARVAARAPRQGRPPPRRASQWSSSSASSGTPTSGSLRSPCRASTAPRSSTPFKPAAPDGPGRRNVTRLTAKRRAAGRRPKQQSLGSAPALPLLRRCESSDRARLTDPLVAGRARGASRRQCEPLTYRRVRPRRSRPMPPGLARRGPGAV